MNKYLVLLSCFLCGCASLPKEVTLIQPLPQHQYVHVAPLVQSQYLTSEFLKKEIESLRDQQDKLNAYLNANGWSAWEIQHDIYDSGNVLDALITSISLSTDEETLTEKERLIKQYKQYLIEYKKFELEKRKELEALDNKARSMGVNP